MLEHVFKICEREGNIDSIYLYVSRDFYLFLPLLFVFIVDTFKLIMKLLYHFIKNLVFRLFQQQQNIIDA